MSVNDCKFNLEILKSVIDKQILILIDFLRNFCSTCLPWDPFHFEIDDILYLHESLQPNVNAFLADLFNFFENQSSTPVQLGKSIFGNQKKIAKNKRTCTGTTASTAIYANSAHPRFKRRHQSNNKICDWGSGREIGQFPIWC
jgi:hypothetical protein